MLMDINDFVREWTQKIRDWIEKEIKEIVEANPDTQRSGQFLKKLESSGVLEVAPSANLDELKEVIVRLVITLSNEELEEALFSIITRFILRDARRIFNLLDTFFPIEAIVIKIWTELKNISERRRITVHQYLSEVSIDLDSKWQEISKDLLHNFQRYMRTGKQHPCRTCGGFFYRTN